MRPCIAAALTALGALVVVKAQTVPGPDAALILRSLPAGARLERPAVRVRFPGAQAPDEVVFYSAPAEARGGGRSSYVAVFGVSSGGLARLWALDCRGAYGGFFADTGVYDINRTGQPKIVVDCEGTTVCPHFFGVYEYRQGKFQAVPSDFEPLDTCQVTLRDLGGDGKKEIVNYPHGGDQLPEIYEWDGAKYARADGRFPGFWKSLGLSYEQSVESGAPVQPFVLPVQCELALKAFALAGHPDMGRLTCEWARDRLKAGRNLAPNLPTETPAALPREREEAISAINTTLAHHPGRPGRPSR